MLEVYGELTQCIKETIDEVVPAKGKQFRNGRAVSKETKELFENAKENSAKEAITKSQKQEHEEIGTNAYRGRAGMTTEHGCPGGLKTLNVQMLEGT